jgi:hypothetical protein
MRTTHAIGLILTAALVLGGCENDAASYQAAEPGVSFTLIREQRWVWDKQSAVAVVVARLPDCQRRYPLNPTRPADAQVDVFQAGPGLYLLRQGNEWHAAGVGDCSLDAVEEPGQGAQIVALGAFVRDGGKLAFSPPAPQ